MTDELPSVALRQATPDDGPAIWQLAGACPPLERNSVYAYVLLADRFPETTLVAEEDGQPVGYLIGIRSATRPGVLFIWQVGVLPSHRGHGLGGRLLDAAVDRNVDVVALETTVSRANGASAALFQGFARRRGATCEITDGYFPGSLLGYPDDDTERLFHVAPLRSEAA